MTTPLDAILARSRSPGAFVARRSFTLSRDRALEKQREFALRHPAQYVLELVQSAVFAGATYLALDARRDGVALAWVGGRRFTKEELENVLDWLFWNRGDRERRHLVQLAIGVNALLQRSPSLLRIESGDGVTGVRLDLDASGRAVVGESERPIAGTYVHAAHTVGWFERFRGPGTPDEVRLVEQRCSYLPVPILVNGTAPFGYRASRHLEVFGATAQESFDDGERRGVVALHRHRQLEVSGFRMVVGGVWVSTLQLPEIATEPPLSGVLCDDGLRKTADQSDIVQDARFVQLLHTVQPLARRLVVSALGENAWRPGQLPPVPVEPTRTDPTLREVVAEPLPASLPCVAPRFATTVVELRASAGRDRGPLFRVDPGDAELLTSVLSPDRFPWTVLCLSEGAALTLGQELREAPPARLGNAADADFVSRALDRSRRERRHGVHVGEDEVTVALVLEGPLPDHGGGRAGVPFCVVDPQGVVEHGVVDGREIRLGGARDTRRTDRDLAGEGLALPHLWFTVRTESPQVGLTLAHVDAVRLAIPVLLAGPSDEPAVRRALTAWLASQAVPQLVDDAAPALAVAVLAEPPGPPVADRRLDGGITLGSMVRAVLDGAVTDVDADAVEVLQPLEQKLGFGHLRHPTLRGRFVAAVVRVGGRWQPLGPEVTDLPVACDHALVVPAVLNGDDDAPPHRVGSACVGRSPSPGGEAAWAEAERLLLTIVSEELIRGAAPRPGCAAARVEGLLRLAAIELAVATGRHDLPLLVPSDGGGRRTLDELWRSPRARLVARHGVRVAEPWTFGVTLDEARALRRDRRPPLRYDDEPSVWTGDPDENGWLLRHELAYAGLRGWLGLREPWDGTTGILLRTTGALIALPELESALPCHGLVWPSQGDQLGPDQRRLVQLAGWRLYQSLVPLLDGPDGPRRDAARRYATAFVTRARARTGRLQGTAAELARRIPVPSVGTLADGFGLPGPGRPPLDGEETTDAPSPAVRADDALVRRLADAIGIADLLVSASGTRAGRMGDPVTLGADSQRAHVSLKINLDHPLARGWAEPGPEQELLLLEAARRVAGFLTHRGRPVTVEAMHPVLVGQRFDP